MIRSFLFMYVKQVPFWSLFGGGEVANIILVFSCVHVFVLTSAFSFRLRNTMLILASFFKVWRFSFVVLCISSS